MKKLENSQNKLEKLQNIRSDTQSNHENVFNVN